MFRKNAIFLVPFNRTQFKTLREINKEILNQLIKKSWSPTFTYHIYNKNIGA